MFRSSFWGQRKENYFSRELPCCEHSLLCIYNDAIFPKIFQKTANFLRKFFGKLSPELKHAEFHNISVGLGENCSVVLAHGVEGFLPLRG